MCTVGGDGDGVYDIHLLRERVIWAEAQHSCAEMRAASPPRGWPVAAPSTLELYASTASEHALRDQGNQLQLQLEASYQRVHLLERRVHERQVMAARPHVRGGCLCEGARGRLTAVGVNRVSQQRWISPRHVLELWEELERDVESMGIDAIGASIQDCKHQESEVRLPLGLANCAAVRACAGNARIACCVAVHMWRSGITGAHHIPFRLPYFPITGPRLTRVRH